MARKLSPPLKGKTSAGVGIVVRTHIEAGLAGPTEDWSPAESPGRLTAMWVRIGLGAGILLLSAYFWHSEVLSARNKQLMISAVTKARLYGCPWVLGADFQVSPEDLLAQIGEDLELADAHVVATCAATFRPTDTVHRTID